MWSHWLLCGVAPQLYSVTETSPSVPVCETFIMFFYDLPVCISSSSVMLKFNKGWKNTLHFLVSCPFLPWPKMTKLPPLPWLPQKKKKKPQGPNLGLVNSETFARCFKLTYFSPFFSCICLYISVCVQTHTKWLLKNSVGTLHSCCWLGESWSQGWVVCRNSKNCYR